MGHTFAKHLYHIVFSTKARRRLITPDLKGRLLHYVSGIVIATGGLVVAGNAFEDHIHLLVRVKPDIALSRFVGGLKANSSKWISETFAQHRMFEWQAGYSSFTVSESNRQRVSRYIAGQEEHHRKEPFEAELANLLRRHGIEFDAEHYLD